METIKTVANLPDIPDIGLPVTPSLDKMIDLLQDAVKEIEIDKPPDAGKQVGPFFADALSAITKSLIPGAGIGMFAAKTFVQRGVPSLPSIPNLPKPAEVPKTVKSLKSILR